MELRFPTEKQDVDVLEAIGFNWFDIENPPS
jgi:hypothetical protein